MIIDVNVAIHSIQNSRRTDSEVFIETSSPHTNTHTHTNSDKCSFMWHVKRAYRQLSSHTIDVHDFRLMILRPKNQLESSPFEYSMKTTANVVSIYGTSHSTSFEMQNGQYNCLHSKWNCNIIVIKRRIYSAGQFERVSVFCWCSIDTFLK